MLKPGWAGAPPALPARHPPPPPPRPSPQRLMPRVLRHPRLPAHARGQSCKSEKGEGGEGTPVEWPGFVAGCVSCAHSRPLRLSLRSILHRYFTAVEFWRSAKEATQSAGGSLQPQTGSCDHRKNHDTCLQITHLMVPKLVAQRRDVPHTKRCEGLSVGTTYDLIKIGS